MLIEQLTEIIRTTNKVAISKQLRELGYTLCNEDIKLGRVGIVELIQSISGKTEDFTDGQCKHLYNGCIYGTIKNYEDYEFVCVNIYDIKPSTKPFDDEDTAIQTNMLIWAKEITK